MPTSDIYAALLGEPPTDQEKLMRLAEQLRGQTDVGRLFQATGDRVVAPTGAGMIKSAESIGERVGQEASTNRWRKTQDAMNERSILARATEAEADRKARAAEAAADRLWRSKESAADRAARAALEGGSKQQAKLDAARERQIARTVTLMNKNALPGLLEAAENTSQVLAKYSNKDIPGVGRLEGLVPNFFQTTEGQSVRSELASVANQVLKMRSGAAVTEPEQRRFLEEVARGVIDEKVFRQRWPKVLKLIEAEQNNILAGMDSEAKDEYFYRSASQPFKARDPFIPGVQEEATAAPEQEDDLSYEAFLKANP